MRAVLIAVAAGLVVLGLFVIVHWGDDAKGARAALKSERLTRCRLVCHCDVGQPCGMASCYDDCRPADPRACVSDAPCPDDYSWSRNECSCIRR